MSDDPLSKSTARLSISTFDVENDNPRIQVKELLNNIGASELSRRDSVVSITSMEEIEKTNERMKRRRSSVPIFNDEKRNKSDSGPKKKKKKKPSLTFKLESTEKRLPFHCLRDLVLKIFNVNVSKFNWLRLENEAHIPNVVFCMTPGLPYDIFTNFKENDQLIPMESIEIPQSLEFFNKQFSHFINTSCPGGKDSIFPPLQAISNAPLTKREKQELLDKSKANSITIHDLLLTAEQLIQHNYPVIRKPEEVDLITEDEAEGWVVTKSFEHEGSHIFALDCEFCDANGVKVLTRISLINFQGEVVHDSYVKPELEITDYLTKYSGITEELLKDVTTTLKDIQEKILTLVSKDDILVGHSLESDLNVMKIKHDKIVDTSVIYEHVRGPPSKPSLRWLSSKFLNRSIQDGEENGEGHSSVEDAQACLDLVKLKIAEGKCFGVNIGEISLFKKISNDISSEGFKSLWINYSDHKYQESYHEPSENMVDVEYVNNDDEVVEKFLTHFNDSRRFTLLSLRELEFNVLNPNIPEHYNGVRDDKENLVQLHEKLNRRLETIYERLPANSLMIVYSIIGNPKEMFRLQGIRKQFQKLEREGRDITKLPSEESWDFDKLQELYEATNNAKKSVTFIKLKE
ncbi:uncharacterized protein RJT21DRAFT_40255 [Scheffersomyces amazonensis]|uniref:uncharacterized protein n=1 Tax=Scheffersomyces amazonensis TaxID=1078765 RepID=UPI00315D57A9